MPPRLWYDKAARDLCQVGFVRHPLDRCVFMSFNGGDLPKSVNEGMERLDGILGLHVDDFIGGGEGMSRVAVEGWNHVPVGEPNFASRVKWLKTKLELGSLHLGLSFPFTGIQLTVSEFRIHSVVSGKLFAESETHCTEQRATTKSSR